MLNFNCALVLLLMLRKHITWLRTKGAGSMLPLDYHIDLHKIIGIIILIESLLHTLAHLAYLGKYLRKEIQQISSNRFCIQCLFITER